MLDQIAFVGLGPLNKSLNVKSWLQVAQKKASFSNPLGNCVSEEVDCTRVFVF